jgi:hypothetical protein
LADRIWAVAVAAEASSPPPREARRLHAAVDTAEARRRPRRWRALAAALVVEARRVRAARVRLARLSPRRVSWSRRARRP